MTETLTIVLGGLVWIAFMALIVQLTLWVLVYRLSRRVQTRVEKSTPAITALTQVSKEILTENRDPVLAISAHTKEIGKTIRHEARVLGSFGSEMRRGIHHEQEHVEVVIQDAHRRMHETMDLVSSGVTAPFRGMARGIRKAVHLFDRAA